MNVGERIKFSFGGEEKEGTVVKIFPKKVYLQVDFPRHPKKLVVRSIAELEGKVPTGANKRRAKREKEKKPRIEEKVEKKPEEAD